MVAAPPTFTVGEKAQEDIVAPVPLIAIDLDGTERLRQEEAQRTPAVLRFDSQATALAEAALRAALATRPNAGNRTESELVSKLREVMLHYIRSDQLPPEAATEPAGWWPLPREAAFDLSGISHFTNTVHRTNVFTKTQARNELIANFAGEDLPVAQFLAGFVRENCFIDIDATRLLRANKTNTVWAVDRYEAGETIIKAGESVDTRKKAALDKLAERAAWDHAQAELVRAQGKAQAAMTSLNEVKASAQERLWTVSLLAVGGFGAVLIIWVTNRSRAHRLSLHAAESLIPLLTSGSGQQSSEGEMLPVLHSWQQRALTAERTAAKLSRALQIRVAPHLARWLAQKFVHQLLSNRGEILAVQQQAAAEISALDKRLEEMHASVQERLRVYENRVLELDAQLRATEQQNRELVEMTIAAAREKLEMERVAAGMEWN